MSIISIPVTTTRAEWWDHTTQLNPANGGRRVQVNARVIAIDPALTSPNAQVAIQLTPSDQPIVLRPGESLTLAATVAEVWVSNAGIPANQITFAMTAALGSVYLLAGGVADLVAIKLRAARARPNFIASQLAYGPNGGYVDTNGCESLRVRVIPLSAAGLPIAPADFAVTLTPVETVYVAYNPVTIALDYAAHAKGSPLSPGGPGMLKQAVTFPDTASAFAFSQLQLSMDYQVGAGGLLFLQTTGLAGAGVASIWLLITGT